MRFLILACAVLMIQGCAAADQRPLVINPTSGKTEQIQAGNTLSIPAATTANASLLMPPGTAPSVPVNGNLWATTLGIYARVNGATVGPLIDASSAGTINGSIASTQVPFGSGVNTISGEAAFTYDTVNNDLSVGRQVLAGVGTIANPSFSFTGDTDTGAYHVAPNEFGIACAGALVGEFAASGLLMQANTQIVADNGTAGLPAFTFTSNSNTGMYRSAASTIGFSTGGTLRASIDTATLTSTLPILAPFGTVNNPGFAFDGDSNTGFYRNAVDTIGFVGANTLMATMDTNALTVNSAQVIAANGSFSAPSYSFAANHADGFYSVGSGAIGLSLNGVLDWTYSGTTTLMTLPLRGAGGSGSAPTYSFSGDTNTGMWSSSGVDVIDFSCGGNLIVEMAATRVVFQKPLQSDDGTAALPTYTFSGVNSTGMYRPSGNLGFSVAGTLRATIKATETLLNNNLNLGTVGNGIYIKEGTNATSGVATLTGGTVVVSTTKVTATSRIQLTGQNLGTVIVPSAYAVSARNAGTDFTILSSAGTDTSDVAWVIVEPSP